MIRYYKTIDSKLEKLKSFESGCWVNLVEPSTAEILEISAKLNVDIESVRAALDEEERSRIDIEDNHILILIDIPVDESDASSTHYSTIPLGIILLDDTIVTVCIGQTKILNDFIVGHVKDFSLSKKLDLFFKFFIKMLAIIYII